MQGPLTVKLTVPMTSSTQCVCSRKDSALLVLQEYATLPEQVKKMGDVFTILADLMDGQSINSVMIFSDPFGLQYFV